MKEKEKVHQLSKIGQESAQISTDFTMTVENNPWDFNRIRK